MIYNPNIFQSFIDAKMQVEVAQSNLNQLSPNIGELKTRYIQNIPFISKAGCYNTPFSSTTVYANEKMAKNHFIRYWSRTSNLNNTQK